MRKLLLPPDVPVIALKVGRLAGEGRSSIEIAREVGVSRATLYRFKKEMEVVTAASSAQSRPRPAEPTPTQGGDDKDMAALNLKGKLQEHGWLKAIKVIGSVPGRGHIWRCKCLKCGKRYRDVPAKKFVSREGGIKTCVECTDPMRRKLYERMRTSAGPLWGDRTFADSWLSTIIAFSPAQLLLFETIADGRYGDRTLMEAADITDRCDDPMEELASFERPRIERAVKRIQLYYNSREDLPKPQRKKKGEVTKVWKQQPTNKLMGSRSKSRQRQLVAS